METPAHAAAPEVPTGLLPSGGQSVSGIPTLSWDRSAGATSYDVQVSPTSSFGTITWSGSTVNSRIVPTTQVPQGADFWRVRAKAGSSTSDWAVESFSRETAAAPTLLSPLGITLKEPDNPPVLSWSSVAGTTSYSVQVSTDPSFADSAAITTFSTKTSSIVVSTLKVPTTYYWRVQATLGSGLTTAWSDSASYLLDGLSAPTLVGPPDNITGDVQDVVLDWNPVAGAATYDVQVSTDQDFLTVVANVTGVVGTSYSPSTTFNNDQYYWRVRPVDASNNKLDWSQVSTWHFRRNWPDQPSLQYPVDGATVGDPFYYQWTPVPHASTYEVQVSSDPTFPDDNRTDECRTVGTTLTPAQNKGSVVPCMPNAAGTYYWRVMALDDPLNPPVQSDIISADVRTFTYFPTLVTQTSPANNATVQVPTMTWQPVAGAAKYKVTYTDTAGGSTSVTTAALSLTPHSALTVGHTYRWQVQTVSDDGRLGAPILAGGQPQFTVAAQDAAVASAPDPTNLPNGKRFPTLTWTSVVNATKYVLYVRPAGTIGFTTSGTFAYPAGEDTGTQFLTPGTYDWKVEAYNGSTFLSDGSVGQVNILPMAAVTSGRAALTGNQITGNAGTTTDSCGATLPNECQNLRQTPVLMWDPDPDAGYYKLYLSFDGEMTNRVSNYNPITVYGNMWSDSSALPDSQAGSAYFWEAVPCRADNTCAPLQHASLAFNKLSNQVDLHPAASNSTNTCAQPGDICNDVTLSWDDYLSTEQAASTDDTVLKNSAATTEAQYYRVQTSTDPNFQSLIDNVTVDQTTFTSLSNTYPEGPVYWRVQAYDGADNPLAWSDTSIPSGATCDDLTWCFTKSSPSPVLATPVSGGTQTDSQAFTWNAQKFAKTYNLEIYKNNDMIGQSSNRIVSASGLLQAAYTPTSPLAVSSTPYTWRVRRLDAKGRTGPWSDLQPFVVVGTPPTLIGPAQGADVPPSDGLFSWQAVADATTYKFERRVLGASSVTQTVTTPALAYAPTAAVAGGDWQWRVTAIDAAGQPLASSDWRDFSVTDHPIAITPVSITGSGAVGTALTAQAPGWNLPGVATTYQWKRGTSSISGASGALYTVTTADVGKDLTVVATGRKDGYKAGSSTSNVITGSAGPAPTASVRPSISGKATYNQVLTANHGTWPGTPKYAYQWLRNGRSIAGATSSSYRVAAADAAQKISVRVTATITGLLPGRSTSAALTVAKLSSTTTAALKSATISRRAHGKVLVTVSVPGLSRPTGKLLVKQGTKTLKSVTLKVKNAGHKTIRLPRLGKGKHKLKVVYQGSSTVKKSTSHTVALKVG